MIQKSLIQHAITKKKSAADNGSVVPPSFLRSSLINIIKAIAKPKLTSITYFWAEFLC